MQIRKYEKILVHVMITIIFLYEHFIKYDLMVANPFGSGENLVVVSGVS